MFRGLDFKFDAEISKKERNANVSTDGPSIIIVVRPADENNRISVDCPPQIDDYPLNPCENNKRIFRVRRCIGTIEKNRRNSFCENILPVCMYCKNIRDDAGTEHEKGKWMNRKVVWKKVVKGAYDVYKDRYRFFITGGARLDIYRKGGNSMVGAIIITTRLLKSLS